MRGRPGAPKHMQEQRLAQKQRAARTDYDFKQPLNLGQRDPAAWFETRGLAALLTMRVSPVLGTSS
jgi:hypothetical protein